MLHAGGKVGLLVYVITTLADFSSKVFAGCSIILINFTFLPLYTSEACCLTAKLETFLDRGGKGIRAFH